MNTHSHVAIVGAGHAGGRVAQHLRALGHSGRVTLIGAEAHAPYERPALSKEMLLGTTASENLVLAPNAFWMDDALAGIGIERVCATVESLDVDARRVRLHDGRHIGFDQLVVATGAAARRLPVPGCDLPGVQVLRTLDDCIALKAAFPACRELAIIGGGVIGMEVASSATKLGMHVTVLEAGSAIMNRCLPPLVSAWLEAQHAEQGVAVKKNVRVEKIVKTGERLQIVTRTGDEPLLTDADCVLMATGADCHPAFLLGTGLADTQGVHVDAHCRSPLAPWLCAAGDVACLRDAESGVALRQETWRNAENQARAVAEMLLGRTEPYRETPWMWTDQHGHAIQVTGTPDGAHEWIVRGSLEAASATLVGLRNGCVHAGVTINQSRDRRHIEALVTGRHAVDKLRMADTRHALKTFL